MIDPKRVELNIYNGIPHLLIPIITDASQAIKVLNWSISEMEKRFKIFAEAGVRNLEGYNEYVNIEIERFPNERISDHHSFYELGFQTSYFLEYTINPYYHTSEDTIDKMNMSYLTKICRLALGTVAGMAEANRVLRNDDIKISVKGSLLSYPAQLIVRVENKRYSDDTANVSIHIEMKNFFTGEYVEGPFNSSSNWVFTKEINDYWEFVLASHTYNNFEFMNLEVTVKGFDDDIGLYKERHTFGIVGKSFILLIPKF